MMLFVVLSLLPLLQATGPPASEPAGLASGWAAIPRSMWLSNYSHAYRAEKTIVAAGLTEDTIVAYNSAQPWSPAHGVVNGSFVRMTFGSLELRGKLLPTGYIIWENGSRWLKERSADSNTTARSVKPSGSAPKPRAATGADESYSYSYDDEASYTYDETTSTGGDETYSYDSYESYESYQEEDASAKAKPAKPPKAKSKTTNAKLPTPPPSRPKTASKGGRHRR